MSTKAAMLTAASSVDLTVWPFSAWLNPTPTGWSRKKLFACVVSIRPADFQGSFNAYMLVPGIRVRIRVV